MMEIIQQVLAFIVAIGILVTIHEYGHFWVARRCGVKVLRFSIGFGNPLFSWHDKRGTEFVVAAIPLGGYVKMLDEREAPVAEEELEQAFNRKPVGQRMAVVLAGPLANFLFAIFAYWLMYLVGVSELAPVIGSVEPETPAASAGLPSDQVIVAVDGQPTRSWSEVNLALIKRLGDSGYIQIHTTDLAVLQTNAGNSDTRTVFGNVTSVAVSEWLVQKDEESIPNPIRALGIKRFLPDVPAKVGQLVPNKPAERAGLLVGDEIVSINGEPVANWDTMVSLIQDNPNGSLDIELRRGNDLRSLSVTPTLDTVQGESRWLIGIGPPTLTWPEEMRRSIRYSAIDAWAPALAKTWDMLSLTLVSLKNMLVGLISIDNLSGPITIAQVAGDSAGLGFAAFLHFLALISINLGIINLLPIPVLDGGHFLYYLIEAVRGKPVSERAQMLGLRVGLSIIAALMLLALYNDFTRL